MGVKLGFSP